jgi:phosphoglycolate phosphatase-like HAD superfamily hydrolase
MRRLLLFDIDGTLVSGGPAKTAFHVALLEAFGTAGPIEVHEFAGKTDPQIARELLGRAGLSPKEIEGGLPTLFDRYLAELENRLQASPMTVLPGVAALIESLLGSDEVGLGLLTGNIEGGAALKLGSAGLFRHFRMGAYGSDSAERNDLPGVALDRAEETWGVRFDPSDVYVIGDTPRDVECGLAHDAMTVGVATGNFGAEALWAAGAHHVVEDLSDTLEVRALLAG